MMVLDSTSDASMRPILYAENLTKDYGRQRALSGFGLAVRPGEVVGILGPNGAGKSTALRSFLGFLKPTAGFAKIAGHDCWSDGVGARRYVSYLPGELRLYDSMTGRQLVAFLGKLRGETYGATIDALATKLEIDPDRRLTGMSSGMKRKVALLTVLLPNVPLMILDEPTNTLDPTMRDEFLEQLLMAKIAGKAVLFSSHVLQEVEAVCDRVLILRRGELVHEQDMAELRDARLIRGRLLNLNLSDLPFAVDDDGRFEYEYRGPAAELLPLLSRFPIEDLRIEPLGLAGIYKHWHGATA